MEYTRSESNGQLLMRTVHKIAALVLSLALVFSLAGCVNQHPEETSTSTANSAEAPESGSADAPDQTSAPAEEQRIIAASNATLWIMDALEIDLVARCTTAGDVPERYRDLPEIGTAMSPDAEAIALLDPTDVIGPDTLAETIEPTYKAAGVPYTFIQLQSVQQMYDSIAMLGEKYDRRAQAQALIDEYRQTLAVFEASIEGKEHPTVLMLMGIPGAYIACTQNSYAGSLPELAGATNVVRVDDEQNFASWNTEELLALDPDYILFPA